MTDSDGLGHLIDEFEAFFRVAADNGGQRTCFDYALLKVEDFERRREHGL